MTLKERLVELVTGNTDAHEKIVSLIKGSGISLDGLGFTETSPTHRCEKLRYCSSSWIELTARGKGNLCLNGRVYPYTVDVVCRQEKRMVSRKETTEMVDFWVTTEVHFQAPDLRIELKKTF